MLKRVHVRNFRRLRDRTFDFTDGLNVVRGANEQGKSTMLEAITYGLFGVKACRTGLADLVTWGEPENSLKVEIDLEVEGKSYRISRSKSGAEVHWEDGNVTGQTEVSAFVGRIFGVSSNHINRLMLSGQGDIRGALAQGQKATSELIEQLANFSIIDDVITLIGEKLLTGGTGPFEEKIARLTPEYATCVEALGQVPDTSSDELALSEFQASAAMAKEASVRYQHELEPIATKRVELEHTLADRDKIMSRAALLEGQVRALEAEVNALRDKEPSPPNRERIEEIRGLLKDSERINDLRKAKVEIESVPVPAAFWEGDLASFNAETNRVKSRSQAVQRELSELTAEARGKRAERVTASVCGMCGKDVSEFPEVAAKNEAIDARLAAIADAERTLKAELQELAESLRTLEQVYASHIKTEQMAIKHADLVRIDKHQVPWGLEWAGPTIEEGTNTGALREELAALNRQESMVISWKAKLEAQSALYEKTKAQFEDILQTANDAKFLSAESMLPSVVEQYNELNNEYIRVSTHAFELQTKAREISDEIARKKAEYEIAKRKVDQVKALLDEAQRDLDNVNFNNALLKKVRAARPIIANKLWTMVLATVSRYFTQMRGIDSVVSKDGDGFKVNGQVIDGLSGSTLDLLGLAIRLALVRTFLPQAPFLVLDEPSAACDAGRTQAMMGFLVAAGFDQMLVVTHEDMSEQVANNLIEI